MASRLRTYVLHARRFTPPISYAITLEILQGSDWKTVRLWDNADHVDEHQEHAYTREGGKQPPMILDFESGNDAMAAAIRAAKMKAPQIVRGWVQEQ